MQYKRRVYLVEDPISDRQFCKCKKRRSAPIVTRLHCHRSDLDPFIQLWRSAEGFAHLMWVLRMRPVMRAEVISGTAPESILLVRNGTKDELE